VIVQPEHRRDAERYLRAAVATLRTCEEWLGPFPHESLTIVDPPWHTTPAEAADTIVIAPVPWWSTRTAMVPEIVTARAVSRRYWSELFDGRAPLEPFVSMLEQFTESRAVTPLFQQDNNPPGYAFLDGRYFGDFVPHFVRVRVLPDRGEDSLSLARSGNVRQQRSAQDARLVSRDTVLTLGTLERWLGRPVFDEVVAELVRAYRGRQPTLADFQRIASDVSGQDLSWFFDQTIRSRGTIDYGLERLTSDRQADGSFLTNVVARRYGDQMFTGSSAPRNGPFESGRAIALRVTFADGTRRLDHWDGRDREKTFSYRSQAAAVSAEIDPAHVLLLDQRRTNNSRTVTPNTSAVATKWAGRWLIWLQDLVLTYAALV
jgi:hypothetical protein